MFIRLDEILAGLDFVEPHRCAEDEIPAGVWAFDIRKAGVDALLPAVRMKILFFFKINFFISFYLKCKCSTISFFENQVVKK
jgi:hypothetical protein